MNDNVINLLRFVAVITAIVAVVAILSIAQCNIEMERTDHSQDAVKAKALQDQIYDDQVLKLRQAENGIAPVKIK